MGFDAGPAHRARVIDATCARTHLLALEFDARLAIGTRRVLIAFSGLWRWGTSRDEGDSNKSDDGANHAKA